MSFFLYNEPKILTGKWDHEEKLAINIVLTYLLSTIIDHNASHFNIAILTATTDSKIN